MLKKFFCFLKKNKTANFLIRFLSPASALLFFCSLISFFLLQHHDGFLLSSLILLAGIGICFCRQKSLRILFGIVLLLVTCVERHFILHYNESFQECGSQALITLSITDSEEVFSYLSLLKAVEWLCAAVFIAAIIFPCIPRLERSGGTPVKKCWSWSAGIASLLFLLLFAGIIAYSPVRDYLRDWKDQGTFLLARKQFRFHASDTAPDIPAVHFLLIGESHRKDVFDAIVLQGASPILSQAKKEGVLFEFDDMITYYQQTWFSVFTLLCRRGGSNMATNFGEKGLFALFQEAGWKVYYVTYQPKTLSTTGYDCAVNEADVYVNAREKTGIKRDNSFLEIIDQILAKKEKKVLIALKMSGCHFQYSTRYPHTERYCRYLPEYRNDEPAECRIGEKEILVNTYRNAMTFSADVFDGIARRCRNLQVPSFLFFLSDHGVINYDDGKNPFFGAARSNFHIPCVIYPNEAYRKRMTPETAAALKKNRTLPAGNDYVFDTLVSLAGLRYPALREEKDLTSPRAVPAQNRQVWVWKKQLSYDALSH